MKILKYPHPYKAWLSISNDPDNTTYNNWKELNEFIWELLELPFGDAFFIENNNFNLPDQVCLKKNPEIIRKHFHDSMHFWGDYQHSRNKNFDREDAINCIKFLKENNINPTVWVDHSFHIANIIHANGIGAKKQLIDASGIEYNNFQYTLDLVIEAGIKYIWGGNISKVIGQDRKIYYSEFLKSKKINVFKRFIYSLLKPFNFFKTIIPEDIFKNKQLWINEFPDENKIYCFERHGTWEDANIDGLAKVISTQNINELIKNTGTSIIYTHLGKRKKERIKDKNHIPEETKNALIYLKDQYDKKELNLSPISTMLDYLIVRDNVTIDNKNKIVNFSSDGIRFKKLVYEDLAQHAFSFFSKNINAWKIVLNGEKTNYTITTSNNIHTITFNDK